MPRRNRTAVPELESPELPPGQTLTLPPEQERELDPYEETGDIGALADASYEDWSWHVYRIGDGREVPRSQETGQRVWITKLHGPIDMVDFQARFGGGLFEFWGYFDKSLRKRVRQSVAGPRKVYDVTPASPPPAAPAALPAVAAVPGLDPLYRLIEDQNRRMDALIQVLRTPAPVAAPPAPAPAPLSIGDVFAVADGISQRRNPEGGAIKELMEVFKMGLELRGEAEKPERSTTEVLIESLAPALERIATAMVTARRAPPRRPPGAAVESTARIVTEPEPGAVPPPEPVNHRWATAVEAMANAIGRGEDPTEFALTLEAILNPQEVGMLRLGNAEQITAQLRSEAAGEFPVLATDAAAAFIAAVLAELKAPAVDEVGA